MQKAFRNVLVIVIIGVIIFGLFSYLNGNGNMPKQLTYNQFTEKLEKGDLKTLEIQPQQNVSIHQLFYITTKKNYKKLLMLLKSKTV